MRPLSVAGFIGVMAATSKDAAEGVGVMAHGSLGAARDGHRGAVATLGFVGQRPRNREGATRLLCFGCSTSIGVSASWAGLFRTASMAASAMFWMRALPESLPSTSSSGRTMSDRSATPLTSSSILLSC